MPIPTDYMTVEQLCKVYTTLVADEIQIIERWASSLALYSDLVQADLFIDCPTQCPDVAVVVAQARPSGGRSLYRTAVVGQLALRENEPGVLEILLTGEPAISRRGLTQEGIPVRQRVVPIKAGQRTIGALIMEQDITEETHREARVDLLSETAEHLTETVLSLAMQGRALPSLLHEGLIILDSSGCVTYANQMAIGFIQDLRGPDDPVGYQVADLPLEFDPGDWAGVATRELRGTCASFLVRAVPVVVQVEAVGHVLLIRDVTEIRTKEKELIVKSAVIQEMHHRVKNSLQTIASLLRLQARRSQSQEVQDTLRETINRIASIATVHEVLSQGGIELVDIRKMAADIARLVGGSMLDPEQRILIEVKGRSLLIASEQATAVALVTNELLHNALDHAFGDRQTGHVEVELRDIGSSVEVIIQDDGIGLPDAFSVSAFGNLGLQIVQTLVERQLKGSLSLRNRLTGGTEIHILFPRGEGGTHGERRDCAAG